jgi:hypothetical protein
MSLGTLPMNWCSAVPECLSFNPFDIILTMVEKVCLVGASILTWAIDEQVSSRNRMADSIKMLIAMLFDASGLVMAKWEDDG